MCERTTPDGGARRDDVVRSASGQSNQNQKFLLARRYARFANVAQRFVQSQSSTTKYTKLTK
jgi:hypothetical protein